MCEYISVYEEVKVYIPVFFAAANAELGVAASYVVESQNGDEFLKLNEPGSQAPP